MRNPLKFLIREKQSLSTMTTMKKLKLYGKKEGGPKEFVATVYVDNDKKVVVEAEDIRAKRDLMGKIFNRPFPLKVSRGPTTPEEKELAEELKEFWEKARKLKGDEDARKELKKEHRLIIQKGENLRKNLKEELIVVPKWPGDLDFLVALRDNFVFWGGKKFGDYKIVGREIVEEVPEEML